MRHGGNNSRDASSVAQMLRFYVPQPLAAAYGRCWSDFGDARDQLGARFGLLDCALRLFVATLAAQLAQRGCALGKEYNKLVNNLHAPSLGNWSRAASEMSETLKEQLEGLDPSVAVLVAFFGRPDVLRLAEVFDGDDPAGGGTSIRRLVEARNGVFHDPTAPIQTR